LTAQTHAVLAADAGRRASGWLTWDNARRNPRIVIGGALVLFLAAVAIFAPLLAPYDPTAVNGAVALEPPSAAHPFGTDDVGRDVLSRVIFGSRVSLSVGLIAVGVGAAIGISLGMAAGYIGGAFDLVSMRLIDALLAFPALLLAIAITAALGPDLRNAMIAIGVVAIPGFTRLSRGQVLAMKNREFVEAARAIGCSDPRIVRGHIFPNITNPLIVQATLAIAGAMLAEAALSFLGLGAQPPTPTWGADVYYSQRYLSNLKWWMSVGPGLGIFLAVFSFNFFGDALRDALDPRLRRSR